MTYVLLIQNFFADEGAAAALQPAWTLAIEEQFYLVWPFLVWLLPTRAIKYLCIGLVTLSPVLRLILRLRYPHMSLYFNTLTRLDGLALGGFLAIWIPATSPTTIKRVSLCTLVVSLPCAILLDDPWIRYSAIALVCAAIVCLSFFMEVKSRILRYTGRISFGLYLIHMGVFGLVNKPVFRRPFQHHPLLSDIAYLITGFVISYVVASLSWKYFESRVLLAKRKFEPPRHNARVPPQVRPPTGALVGR